jgi:hypothetical protein
MSGRRIPIVVVLIALLVAAAVAGNRRVRADAGVRESALAASIPLDGVRSSAWYCSGGPVGRGPSGDQVTISDVGSHSVRVAIDVMVADTAERGAPERFVTVPARSSTTIQVASLSRVPSAALVVQPLGGGVVVEQGYALNGDIAMAPCATQTSSSWYFAAGSSVGGAQTWLSLFNPFGVDAVVDVEADSENGFRAPGSLQGLVVPHGSRLAVRIDQTVAEQRIAAVAVRARGGSRIVATQSVVQPRGAGASSVSMSLGALAPSRSWMFADNRSQTGTVQQLVLANPGGVDATARVSVVPDVAATIEPRIVRIPATTAVAVDFSSVVPAGVAYTLVVQSAVPIVAETRQTYVAGTVGLVTEVGSPSAATRWSFTGGPFTATGLGGGQRRVAAGYDLTVVMKVGATASQIGAMHSLLPNNGHIQRVHTVTRDVALNAFRSTARDNPALLGTVTRDMVPVTFDVAVESSHWIEPLRSYLAAKDGVATVVTVANEGPLLADDVVVLNPGSRPVTVSMTATAGGKASVGAGMTGIVIAPGRQATVSLLPLAERNAAVVVRATGPVVAERLTAGPWGVSRAPGVPWFRG